MVPTRARYLLGDESYDICARSLQQQQGIWDIMCVGIQLHVKCSDKGLHSQILNIGFPILLVLIKPKSLYFLKKERCHLERGYLALSDQHYSNLDFLHWIFDVW